MGKIFKIIEKALNLMFNMFVLLGIGIFLAWLFAGISPQKSFSSMAYFFQNAVSKVSGQHIDNNAVRVVTQEQLEYGAKKMKVVTE